MSEFWSATDRGVTVRVRVTPKARAAKLGGVVATADGPALACAVAAPPEDGKANAAVVAALAAALDVPRRAVAVAGGATHRVKRLTVVGDTRALGARLAAFA